MKHHAARIAQQIRTRLSDIFAGRVSDPRLRDLVITEVRLSPDLSVARVFYLVRGDREAAREALGRASPFVRRALAQGLSLRRVPELQFHLDRSLDRAQRIDQILDEIGDQAGGRGGTA